MPEFDEKAEAKQSPDQVEWGYSVLGFCASGGDSRGGNKPHTPSNP